MDGGIRMYTYSVRASAPRNWSGALSRRSWKDTNDIYDALIFIPAGALLGIAITGVSIRSLPGYLAVALLYLLPPWIFDQILSHFSRRSPSFKTMALCLVLAIAGSLWINSDRSQKVALEPVMKAHIRRESDTQASCGCSIGY